MTVIIPKCIRSRGAVIDALGTWRVLSPLRETHLDTSDNSIGSRSWSRSKIQSQFLSTQHQFKLQQTKRRVLFLMTVTGSLSTELLPFNDLDPRAQTDIRLLTQIPSPHDSTSRPDLHWLTIIQPLPTTSTRHKQVPRIPLHRLNSRVLMEYLLPLRLNPRESTWDVQVIRSDDGILCYIFKHVMLRIGIGDVIILIVVVEPILRRWFPDVGLLLISPQCVKGVRGFMDEGGEVVVYVVEENDIATWVVCPGPGSWSSINRQ